MAKKKVITHIDELWALLRDPKGVYVKDPNGVVNKLYVLEEYEEHYGDDWEDYPDENKTGSLLLANRITLGEQIQDSKFCFSYYGDMWAPEEAQLRELGVTWQSDQYNLVGVVSEDILLKILEEGYKIFAESPPKVRKIGSKFRVTRKLENF